MSYSDEELSHTTGKGFFASFLRCANLSQFYENYSNVPRIRERLFYFKFLFKTPLGKARADVNAQALVRPPAVVFSVKLHSALGNYRKVWPSFYHQEIRPFHHLRKQR